MKPQNNMRTFTALCRSTDGRPPGSRLAENPLPSRRGRWPTGRHRYLLRFSRRLSPPLQGTTNCTGCCRYQTRQRSPRLKIGDSRLRGFTQVREQVFARLFPLFPTSQAIVPVSDPACWLLCEQRGSRTEGNQRQRQAAEVQTGEERRFDFHG